MSKTSSITSILLGGTLYDEQKRNFKNLTNKCGKEIKLDVVEYERDFSELERNLKERDIKVFASYPPQIKCQKEDVIISLKNFFNSNAKTFIIYWCGHGEIGSGDWTFSFGKILKPDELFKLFIDSNAGQMNKPLILISDSCYSGNWINEIKKKPPNINLVYQSGCTDSEEAWINLTKDRHIKNQKGSIKKHIFGSFLLNQIFYDLENGLDSKYVWTSSRQHPKFYSNIKNLETKERNGEKMVLYSNLRFFECHKHWIVKSHGKEASLVWKNEMIIKSKEKGYYFEKDFEIKI